MNFTSSPYSAVFWRENFRCGRKVAALSGSGGRGWRRLLAVISPASARSGAALLSGPCAARTRACRKSTYGMVCRCQACSLAAAATS